MRIKVLILEIIANYKKHISIFHNLNETEILKNIHFINIISIDEMLQFMDYLNEFLKDHQNVGIPYFLSSIQ